MERDDSNFFRTQYEGTFVAKGRDEQMETKNTRISVIKGDYCRDCDHWKHELETLKAKVRRYLEVEESDNGQLLGEEIELANELRELVK